MECTGHAMSHAPYVSICECAAPKKVRRTSGSTAYDVGLSASQVVMSVGDSTSNVTGISSLNSVCEDKSLVFKTYRGPLPIHPRLYEFPLGSCRSGDLNVVPSRGGENDARDVIR